MSEPSKKVPPAPSPLIPLVSREEMERIVAAQPRVTKEQFWAQLNRSHNPGRHGVIHRVHGVRRFLQRLLAFQVDDLKPEALGKLRAQLARFRSLEDLLSHVAQSVTHGDDLLRYSGNPGYYDAWLLQSPKASPVPEAKVVTWEGFPYWPHSPRQNPTGVEHVVMGGVDQDSCGDCERHGVFGEHDWDPAIWIRIFKKTPTGWEQRDVLRCLVCAAEAGERPVVVHEGEAHPLSR